MGAVKPLDLHCGGVVSVSDALVVLKYAGEGKCTGRSGCTPPGTINGAPWVDVYPDVVVDAREALPMLLDAAGLT